MSSKLSRNNKQLASEIEEIGVIMSSHCLYCSQHDKECVCSEKSIRCSKCCQLGCHCVVNAGPSNHDWDKLHSKHAKLKAAESHTQTEICTTHAEMCAAQSSMVSLFAKINHLEQQCDFLESHAGKFLESEVKTIEELEHLEEKKKKRVTEQTEIQNLFASLNDFPLTDSLFNFSNSFMLQNLLFGMELLWPGVWLEPERFW
ncbi:hypothetical protein LOZ65_002344 [Ophidiomyces ophidiicola]|nr:hypothetical protein LOZ65_002344 [Ophidiomyces ophidiicola]